MNNHKPQKTDFEKRVNELVSFRYNELIEKTDHMFCYLLLFQWMMAITFALWISPRTWSGEFSQTHLHVYAAVFLGGLLALVPVLATYMNPGATINRMLISISQILFSTLLIHLTGGRIETHFHVFGSLAFLAFYRDPRPVLIATAITALDHILRGALWPQSVYGTLTSSLWRAMEHAGWVVFEDIILLRSIKVGLEELKLIAQNQAKLENSVASIEEQVKSRTKELEESQRVIVEQQGAMIASAKMSSLGEMAGGIAHEINNPLAIIKGKASIVKKHLIKGSLDVDKLGEELLKIENTTERIAKIIRGLRSFSRNAAADPMEVVRLSSVLEDTLELCQERFKNHSIELRIDCQVDTSLECRPSQLSQVLINLLGNAHDAVKELPQKWVAIETVVQLSTVTIRITDSGTGIPTEVAEKMMLPFFTTKEVGKGTGLGLSISKGIVEDHHGQLYLDPSHRNTCFVIELPLKQPVIEQINPPIKAA